MGLTLELRYIITVFYIELFIYVVVGVLNLIISEGIKLCCGEEKMFHRLLLVQMSQQRQQTQTVWCQHLDVLLVNQQLGLQVYYLFTSCLLIFTL